MRIEDYALIGDTQTAALVGRDGSVDWLCLPRFDAGACFAALVGDRGNGRWKLAPAHESASVTRRYLPDTLVLETTFATPSGVVRLVDCMPVRFFTLTLTVASDGDGDPARVTDRVEGISCRSYTSPNRRRTWSTVCHAFVAPTPCGC